MEELMRSLLELNAIPEARRRFFFRSDLLHSWTRAFASPGLESNGTRGDAIFRHPHFVKYLHYFVYGSDLPKPVIETFQQKVIDCGKPFTSGDSIGFPPAALMRTRPHAAICRFPSAISGPSPRLHERLSQGRRSWGRFLAGPHGGGLRT
jgi:hypothetical protein